jgi:O-antigen/teichoic acid export membrane protein
MIFRNINFIKQLKLSFIYKIISLITSFVLVKYMLEYLGPLNYGIWVVILTFINWIIFFDFGIANGIKNKVSESLSKNNIKEAREYISTGYVILLIFSVITYILFFALSFFINWQSIFNVENISNTYLHKLMIITLFFILANFTLSIIIAIFNATQNASLIVFQQLLSQFFALVLVCFLNNYTESSLLHISFAYGFSLLLSNVLMSYYFYIKNKNYIPSFSFYKKDKVKSIFSLGMKFFYLQLTILIILSSDVMIITQLLGSSYVTKYDILFKYFGILMIVHTIINTPLWSMYTEAYNKGDYVWIEKTLIKMILLMFIYIILSVIMYFSGDKIIELWLNNTKLDITNSNYIYSIIMTLMLIWFSIFAYFTNGINKTNTQLLGASIGAIINIPLSIYFVKNIEMGIDGVLLATTISLSIFGIMGPIQAIREIKKMKLDNIKERK